MVLLAVLTAAVFLAADWWLINNNLALSAYGFLAGAIAANWDSSLLSLIYVAMGAWLAMVVLHFTLWRAFQVRVLQTPTSRRPLPGDVGEIVAWRGMLLMQIDDHLWPVQALEELSVGDRVRIERNIFQTHLVSVQERQCRSSHL